MKKMQLFVAFQSVQHLQRGSAQGCRVGGRGWKEKLFFFTYFTTVADRLGLSKLMEEKTWNICPSFIKSQSFSGLGWR